MIQYIITIQLGDAKINNPGLEKRWKEMTESENQTEVKNEKKKKNERKIAEMPWAMW